MKKKISPIMVFFIFSDSRTFSVYKKLSYEIPYLENGKEMDDENSEEEESYLIEKKEEDDDEIETSEEEENEND
jgi:hypothetical protein